MLKGVDYGNVDSRRAYPLDGRTTWVESTVAKGYVVSKDNRVLGPGEYSPGMPTQLTKHVSAPSIGGSRGIVDHFHPFRSMLSTRTPGNAHREGGFGGAGSVSQNSVVSFDEEASYFAEQPPAYSISNDISRYHSSNKHEGMTIFHEHDRRIALDPKLRTTPTPGPGNYKTWSSNPLRSISHHAGLKESNRTVHMGQDDIPFGERMDVRPALPDYDSMKSMDTEHFRKGKKLLTINPNERQTKFDLDERRRKIEEGIIEPAVEHRQKRLEKIKKLNGKYDPDESSMGLVTAESSASFQGRPIASPISSRPQARAPGDSKSKLKGAVLRYPILKTRKPPTIEFDRSSYKNLNAALEASFAKDQIELNPRQLDKEARINVFNQYVAMPRKHHGHRVPSRLSDKIKRSVF